MNQILEDSQVDAPRDPATKAPEAQSERFQGLFADEDQGVHSKSDILFWPEKSFISGQANDLDDDIVRREGEAKKLVRRQTIPMIDFGNVGTEDG
ncbi:MAG: hypothetical protein Q9174_004042 [Haloplaca sp. 1 TL-2023]